jgi:hypothetical protein
MIVDCYVNIWEERHLSPLFAEQRRRASNRKVPCLV